MKKEPLIREIKNKNYEIVVSVFSPEFIVTNLEYTDSMKLAYSIFKSDLQNDEFQEFALNRKKISLAWLLWMLFI